MFTLIWIYKVKKPEDCESVPLKTGFRSAQLPFKTGFTVY